MTDPITDPGPFTDVGAFVDQLAGQAPIEAEDAAPPEPVFADLDEFVREYLAVVVERRVAGGAGTGIYWCATWWKHPEAISRLYALWRAWETLRVADPDTGMSVWWRDHLDPHLAALSGEYGPFTRCGPDRHYDSDPLPAVPAPPEILAVLPDAGG